MQTQRRHLGVKLCVWMLGVVVSLQGQPTLAGMDHLAPKHRGIGMETLSRKLGREKAAKAMPLLIKLAEKNFSDRDLRWWVEAVAAQPRVVDKIGLDPFYEFAAMHGSDGILALAMASVWQDDVASPEDLDHFAIALKTMIRRDAGLKEIILQDLASDSPFGPHSPLRRLLLQHDWFNSTIRPAMQWFGMENVTMIQTKFREWNASALVEWIFLHDTVERFLGVMRQEDLVAFILSVIQSSKSWKEYCATMRQIEETILYQSQLNKYLDGLRRAIREISASIEKAHEQVVSCRNGLSDPLRVQLNTFGVLKRNMEMAIQELDNALGEDFVLVDAGVLETRRKTFVEKKIPRLEELSRKAALLKQTLLTWIGTHGRKIQRFILARQQETIRKKVAPALDALCDKSKRFARSLNDYRLGGEGVGTFRLDQVVAEVIDRRVQDSRTIEIKRDVKGAVPVTGSQIKIQMLLDNLVRNAVVSMEGKGTLTVIARTHGDEVVLSVSDTGHGMTPAEASAVLALDIEHGKVTGLAVARRWVEEMGGSLEIISRPRKGTMVMLRLPMPLSSYLETLDAKGRLSLTSEDIDGLAKYFRPENKDEIMRADILPKVLAILSAAGRQGYPIMRTAVANARTALNKVVPDLGGAKMMARPGPEILPAEVLAVHFIQRHRAWFRPLMESNRLVKECAEIFKTRTQEDVCNAINGSTLDMGFEEKVILDEGLVEGLKAISARDDNEIKKITGLTCKEWRVFLWALYTRSRLEFVEEKSRLEKLPGWEEPDMVERYRGIVTAYMMLSIPLILEIRGLTHDKLPVFKASFFRADSATDVHYLIDLGPLVPAGYRCPSLHPQVRYNTAARDVQINFPQEAQKSLRDVLAKIENVTQRVEEALRVLSNIGDRTLSEDKVEDAAEDIGDYGPGETIRQIVDAFIGAPSVGKRARLLGAMEHMLSPYGEPPAAESWEQYRRLKDFIPSVDDPIMKEYLIRMAFRIAHPYSAQILLAFVEDKLSFVGKRAIEGMANLPYEETVCALVSLAQTHPSKDVYQAAAEALNRVFPKLDYDNLIALLGNESWAIRERAVTELKTYPKNETISALAEVAREDPEDRVRVKAKETLCEMLPKMNVEILTSWTKPILLEIDGLPGELRQRVLDSPWQFNSEKEFLYVARELPNMAQDAQYRLLEVLARNTAAWAKSSKAKAQLRALAPFLKDADPLTRIPLAEILGQVGDEEILDALRGALEDGRQQEALQQAIARIEERVRAQNEFPALVEQLSAKGTRHITPEALDELARMADRLDSARIKPQVYARLETLLRRLVADPREELPGPVARLRDFTLVKRFGVDEETVRQALKQKERPPSAWLVMQPQHGSMDNGDPLPAGYRYSLKTDRLVLETNPASFFERIAGTTKFHLAPPMEFGAQESLSSLLSKVLVDEPARQELTARVLRRREDGTLPLRGAEHELMYRIDSMARNGEHNEAVEALAGWADPLFDKKPLVIADMVSAVLRRLFMGDIALWYLSDETKSRIRTLVTRCAGAREACLGPGLEIVHKLGLFIAAAAIEPAEQGYQEALETQASL